MHLILKIGISRDAECVNTVSFPKLGHILSTTNISDEHKKVYSRVVSKFDEYFGVWNNLVFE